MPEPEQRNQRKVQDDARRNGSQPSRIGFHQTHQADAGDAARGTVKEDALRRADQQAGEADERIAEYRVRPGRDHAAGIRGIAVADEIGASDQQQAGGAAGENDDDPRIAQALANGREGQWSRGGCASHQYDIGFLHVDQHRKRDRRYHRPPDRTALERLDRGPHGKRQPERLQRRVEARAGIRPHQRTECEDQRPRERTLERHAQPSVDQKQQRGHSRRERNRCHRKRKLFRFERTVTECAADQHERNRCDR